MLLKTLSTLLHLREFGLLLCKAILNQSQLTLVVRGLGASKEKEHLISPCFRLLTEVATFDGGALIHRLHAARSFTLDARLLPRCLSLASSQNAPHQPLQEMPTVRSNCVRYLLSLLKLSSPHAKAEIIKTAPITRALFGHMSQDGPALLTEVFDTLTTHVLKDSSIPRANKGYLFNDQTLSNLANLYRTENPPANTDQSPKRVDILAHEFLRFICSEPEAGVLRASSGFYPPGSDRSDADEGGHTHTTIHLGLDSVEWYDKYDSKIPVSNVILSKLSKQLRPYSTQLERRLLALIFQIAPELVAEYFKTTRFSFDAKLTSTWIGYASFLSSAIQTKVPPYFGRRDRYDEVPPPVSVLIENILPSPMQQKVITRCLHQKIEIISFAVVQLLIKAFTKLGETLVYFNEAITIHGDLWREGKGRLMDAVVQRCPPIKDVVNKFRQIREDNVLHRESLLRLLCLYHQFLPELAAEQKFDPSVALTRSLDISLTPQGVHDAPLDASRVGETTDLALERPGQGQKSVSDPDLHTKDERESSMHVNKDASQASNVSLDAIQLGHLLHLAAHTSDTRWFAKPESSRLSTFASLLRKCALGTRAELPEGIYDLLAFITQETEIFQKATDIPALDALLASLAPSTGWYPDEHLFEWLDDTLQRIVVRPIKYQDDMDAFRRQAPTGLGPMSPLWMTLREQWPYVLERSKIKKYAPYLPIAEFLARFMAACEYIGEDAGLLKEVREEFARMSSPASDAQAVFLSMDNAMSDSIKVYHPTRQTPKPNGVVTIASELQSTPPSLIDPSVFAPEPLLPDHSSAYALHAPLKYSLNDLNDAVTTGALSELVLCLSSDDADVQSQALANIRAFSKKLTEPRVESCIPSAKQLWLLVGILSNTVTPVLESRSEDVTIPHIITTFSSIAAMILTNPRHILYEPINKFLLRGPVFKKDRLLKHWLHVTLRSPPPPSAYRGSSRTKTHNTADTPGTPTPNILPLATLGPSPYPGNPHHAQLHFLISLIYHSARTASDIDILRRCANVIEALLASCGADVALPRDLRELIIAMLWRVTAVPSGSDMLITRCGILPWISGLVDTRGVGKGGGDLLGRQALRLLMARVWETSDQAAMERWGGATVQAIVRRVVGDGDGDGDGDAIGMADGEEMVDSIDIDGEEGGEADV